MYGGTLNVTAILMTLHRSRMEKNRQYKISKIIKIEFF